MYKVHVIFNYLLVITKIMIYIYYIYVNIVYIFVITKLDEHFLSIIGK